MQALPIRARIFLCCVYAVGAATALAFACGLGILPWTEIHADWLWAVFLALAALFGSRKVHLLRFNGRKDHEATWSLSLGFIVIFASLLRFGPQGAVAAGGITTLLSCVYPRRQPLHQAAFNLALNLIQTLACSLTFVAINRDLGHGQALGLHWPGTAVAVVIASLTFFAINTGAIATIVGMTTGKPIPAVWQDAFLWTAPSYVLGAGLATVAVALVRDNLGAFLIITVPVAYLTHFSYEQFLNRAEELLRSKDELAAQYLETVRSLALAIDAKDQYTHQHILRVQRYAAAIARHLGLSEDEVRALETSALLHDIGKIGVPEYVLLKPGRLTEEEFAKIREHPRIGADILAPVHFPWPVLDGVKHHHEKWDGTGYPDGLAGEAIPLQGRILAVADVFDALTSNRSYRNAWSHEAAKTEIDRSRNRHFDPRIADAFLEVVDGVVRQMAEEGIGPLVAAANRPAVAPSDGQGVGGAAVRDIQRASSELWALYEVTQVLNAGQSLSVTLDAVAHHLEALHPGGAVVILLRDAAPPREAPLTIRAAAGANRTLFLEADDAHAESLSEQVTRAQKGIPSSYRGAFDPNVLLRLSHKDPAATLRAALIVPVCYEGGVLGTLNLYHPEPDAFQEDDEHFARLIAARLAEFVGSSRSMQEEQDNTLQDLVTGLGNLRRFAAVVEDLCARSFTPTGEREPFALLQIELEDFSALARCFGSGEGDRLRQRVASCLEAALQDSSSSPLLYAAGRSFLVVLEGAERDEAGRIAELLQTRVRSLETGLVHPEFGRLGLSPVIGISCFPEEGQRATVLLTAAEASLKCVLEDRHLARLAKLTLCGASIEVQGGPVDADRSLDPILR